LHGNCSWKKKKGANAKEGTVSKPGLTGYSLNFKFKSNALKAYTENNAGDPLPLWPTVIFEVLNFS